MQSQYVSANVIITVYPYDNELFIHTPKRDKLDFLGFLFEHIA